MTERREPAERAEWIDCYACTGRFTLAITEDGAPMALHTDEPCAAFDALQDQTDAVMHARRCRAATEPN